MGRSKSTWRRIFRGKVEGALKTSLKEAEGVANDRTKVQDEVRRIIHTPSGSVMRRRRRRRRRRMVMRTWFGIKISESNLTSQF